MAAYIATVRSTRKLLEEKERAARSGVIDDLGFLETAPAADMDQSIAKVTRAREAYARHRREQHEATEFGTP